jgi:hypothetical protein
VGDGRIDMVISHIDMGCLVTLGLADIACHVIDTRFNPPFGVVWHPMTQRALSTRPCPLTHFETSFLDLNGI